MKWFELTKYKPNLRQQVLIYRQGYDHVNGTRYWFDFETAIFDIDWDDKRKRAFYEPREYEYKMRDDYDGSLRTRGRNMWKYRDVTHWMPLPEPPEKITREGYAKLFGINYEREQG